MITDPHAATVLCYGDSNTHGHRVEEAGQGRWPADVRWTGRLQILLGGGCYLIEEGLPGRTIDVDDPERPGRNGRTYLLPCLDSHGPVEVVVLMLGTNDLKPRFGRSPAEIANALGGLLDDIGDYGTNRDGNPPKAIVVLPAPIEPDRPLFAELWSDGWDADSAVRSHLLAGPYREQARRHDALFVDAGTAARVGVDGVHLSLDSQGPLAELIAGAVTRVLRPG